MNGLFEFFRTRVPRAVPSAPGAPLEVEVDGYANQMVAQGMPERAHLNADGRLVSIQDTTARAAVTAYPTTASLYGIWNGNPQSGKSFVVDAITCTFMAQAAAIGYARVIANLVRIALAAPTAVGTVVPLNGAANYGGSVRGFATPTTVAADGWFDIGNGVLLNSAASVPGAGVEIPVNGSLIVRPGGFALALSILGASASITGILGVRGHEVQLPLAN